MRRNNLWVVGLLSAWLGATATARAATVRLDELDVSSMSAGWGKPQKNQSITERPLSIGGQTFEHGVGTHANSECWIVLDGKVKSFSARVGVDDNANNGAASIEFWIYGDGRELWRSGVCKWQDKPRECRVELAGVRVSGDMAKLDAFTLNVLCNHEVIEVDQDPLGKQARILRQTRRELVLVKDLEDGSKAVGLFNLGPVPVPMSVSWDDIGLSGQQRVRDLWRQRDLGSLESQFEAEVPRHGVALVRIGQP